MAERKAGVLLHPTSLPGRFGSGDLGPSVDRFLDWAQSAGQSLWQILPLGPPEIFDSPYSCLSAFAGNPLLISPERLLAEGLLEPQDFPQDGSHGAAEIPFESAPVLRLGLLEKAWRRLGQGAAAHLEQELSYFCSAPEQGSWLEDWTLFNALREEHRWAPWWEWPTELALRKEEALEEARQRNREAIAYHAFLQFLFHRQWNQVRTEATRRGIELLGDLPIYVARNSADVWSRREIFDLDDEGMPRAVAGVPPDDFSDTGQLWGNPLYRWPVLAEDGFGWWIERLAANLRLTDRVRLDHFRGFFGYWAVDSKAATAQEGSWLPGPGAHLLEALERSFGGLPLVAENLGVITPDIEQVRRGFALPGMAVLHFGFGDDPGCRDHLPHRYVPGTVVYTGTHDNETTAGWFEGLSPEARQRVRTYTGTTSEEVHWGLIRLAYGSVADLAVIPAQDLLGLGNEARMNTPGRAEGNWRWRLEEGALTPELAERLAELTNLTDRSPVESRP